VPLAPRRRGVQGQERDTSIPLVVPLVVVLRSHAPIKGEAAAVEMSGRAAARDYSLRHGLRRAAEAMDRPGLPYLSNVLSQPSKANDGKKLARAERAP
jgi:hypothetical protein